MAYGTDTQQHKHLKNGRKGVATPAYVAKGARIMQIADVLRPRLMEKLSGCRDENGMPVQPARIRGIALIVAQELARHG